MPISYRDRPESSRVGASPSLPSDPFGAALLSLLDDARDVASERVWQEIPRLIAQQWASFSQHQSPLSTMGMISRAAETVLKIRLASRKGGGEEEARRLAEFQGLMADIWGADSATESEVAGSWSVVPGLSRPATSNQQPETLRFAEEGGGPE